MKIYPGLTIIFALVIFLGLIPISDGFYRPTHTFLKNTEEAILEKQLETRIEKIMIFKRVVEEIQKYWRWKTICIGALSETYPVYISPKKTYELLFKMY